MEKGMMHRAAHGLVLVCALVASSLTFAYVLPGNAKGCGTGYAALVSAMSAAVMAFAGLVLIFTSHDKLNRYITAGASVLMMVAVSFVYEMIYQGKCRAPSDDGDMRQSVLVFATIHYAASILSIVAEKKATTSILSLAGAGVSFVLAVAALVLQQMDGGVKTICSEQAEDDFEGVAIFVVVITALLLGGYYLSRRSGKTSGRFGARLSSRGADRGRASSCTLLSTC